MSNWIFWFITPYIDIARYRITELGMHILEFIHVIYQFEISDYNSISRIYISRSQCKYRDNEGTLF